MGCTASVKDSARSVFRPIPDRFTTIEQVQHAIRSAGLESSNLIFGVDFTKSNTWSGKRSFGGRCLHDLARHKNPYQQTLSVLARTLEEFDDDKLIPAFGFGDSTTGDRRCFPFHEGNRPSHGVAEVLQRYQELAAQLTLAGPTSFAPLIREAINIVCDEGNAYHILVIIADGQVTDASSDGETARAIVEASDYPLSIVVVGVGDGPWETMNRYDDELPARKFDNFQFVEFNKVARGPGCARDAQFALHCLMEIPDQYRFIKQSGMLSQRTPARMRPSMLAPSPPTQLAPHSQQSTAVIPVAMVQQAKGVPGPVPWATTPPPGYAPPGYASVTHAAPAAEWY